MEETDYNIDSKINKNNFIKVKEKVKEKISKNIHKLEFPIYFSCKLYIITDVDEDYPFNANTKEEITEHKWFKISDLIEIFSDESSGQFKQI